MAFSQTLSSLALVFALHHYKPTPLYVMDEIDAALGTHSIIIFLQLRLLLQQVTKEMSLQISRMSLLLGTTSRSGQKMLSSSS